MFGIKTNSLHTENGHEGIKMKYILVVLFLMLTFTFSARSQHQEKLNTTVYDWNKLSAEHTRSGEKRQILEGRTNTLIYLEISAITLKSGRVSPDHFNGSTEEKLIIVKDGSLEQNLNGEKKVLEQGSVTLVLPGDHLKIKNAGKTTASYYLLSWKVDNPISNDLAKNGGGSKFYAYNEIEFRKTSKGGTRHFMRRPTATLSELEMHTTTLNENTASHAEHVHESEEIILVIKGEVEESINGLQHQAGPGSLILLMNSDSHGIRNIGEGECEYFAFQWTK